MHKIHELDIDTINRIYRLEDKAYIVFRYVLTVILYNFVQLSFLLFEVLFFLVMSPIGTYYFPSLNDELWLPRSLLRYTLLTVLGILILIKIFYDFYHRGILVYMTDTLENIMIFPASRSIAELKWSYYLLINVVISKCTQLEQRAQWIVYNTYGWKRFLILKSILFALYISSIYSYFTIQHESPAGDLRRICLSYLIIRSIMIIGELINKGGALWSYMLFPHWNQSITLYWKEAISYRLTLIASFGKNKVCAVDMGDIYEDIYQDYSLG